MTCGVVGATGNTGSIVVETLLERGETVRAIGRDAGRLQPFAQRGAEAHVADVNDPAAMTKAFAGMESAYVLIPPQTAAPDFLAASEAISDSITAALKASSVKHVVLLSSLGAQHASGTGPVVGLHNFEQKLNQLTDINVLFLRPAFFMENFLMSIGLIQNMGILGGAIKGTLQIPMIDTQDIGRAAADALTRRDFEGKETQELLGQRNLSHKEAAEIIGKEIGRPGLAYQQFPGFMVEQVLKQMGLPKKTAELLVEMHEAFNKGLMAPLEQRNGHNTTPTTFEAFVR